MKITGTLLSGMILLSSLQIQAQSTVETALLFSRIRPGGSARIQAMGGAQVSLGGDFSSSYSNPAGLGMYNRSEFTVSPAMNFFNSNSEYLDNSTTASTSNFFIPGLSIAFNSPKNQNKFLSGTFGASFNRVNDFNKTFSYEGTNSSNSMIDYFISDATGFQPSSFEINGDNFNSPTGLAYNNYLIEDSTFYNPSASNTEYLSVMGTYPNNPNDIRRQLQHEDVKTSGAQNQWSFSYGANFEDKVFLGAGFGLASIRYIASKTYTESNYSFDLDPNFNPLSDMTLKEDLKISGSGFNGTFGMIVRPVDMVQLGVSYNTPTVYLLTDTYKASMQTNWNNFDYFGDGNLLSDVSEETDDVVSEYKLRTPGRLNFGATFFLKKHGFVSADVELVNYDGAKYSATASGLSYDYENTNIKSLYTSVANYRVGGEYRFKNYRARAGYSFMPDPFKSVQNGVNRKISILSGGFGYKTSSFFIDLAVIYTTGNSSYRPYRINSPDSPLVTTLNKTTTAMITLGFPF